MAASVLNSTRAIEVSVFVVRAFVLLRETLAQHKEIAQKIEQLERKLSFGTSHTSVPQKRIFAEVCQRPASLFAVAI